jgi:cysteinyl-tRNA synthetase
MIATLIEKGNAYEKDGHVLFNVPSYNAYGQLSGCNRDEQVAGARVEVAPYKRDPADFVLWKPSTETQPGWDSPWGYGRPGWHIECSVMAREFLGDVFDIHGGGHDLTFPHHENEIAQSCCASGQDTFANYWVHNGFVTVEGEKMSKSIGNVLTIHDMINDGLLGEAMRLNLLSTHYRQPMNWTQDGLEQSLKTLDKWYDAMGGDAAPTDELINALYDDLNTPMAISVLHGIAKNDPSSLKQSANMLGLLKHTAEEWRALRTQSHWNEDTHLIESLIEQRNIARANKDFAQSDIIRDQLTAMGIQVKDNADGSHSWIRI